MKKTKTIVIATFIFEESAFRNEIFGVMCQWNKKKNWKEKQNNKLIMYVGKFVMFRYFLYVSIKFMAWSGWQGAVLLWANANR